MTFSDDLKFIDELPALCIFRAVVVCQYRVFCLFSVVKTTVNAVTLHYSPADFRVDIYASDGKLWIQEIRNLPQISSVVAAVYSSPVSLVTSVSRFVTVIVRRGRSSPLRDLQIWVVQSSCSCCISSPLARPPVLSSLYSVVSMHCTLFCGSSCVRSLCKINPPTIFFYCCYAEIDHVFRELRRKYF